MATSDPSRERGILTLNREQRDALHRVISNEMVCRYGDAIADAIRDERHELRIALAIFDQIGGERETYDVKTEEEWLVKWLQTARADLDRALDDEKYHAESNSGMLSPIVLEYLGDIDRCDRLLEAVGADRV